MPKRIDYKFDHLAYVADDGNYGVDSVMTFDFDEFIAQYPEAWDVLDQVYERSRTELLLAIFDQDIEALKGFAEEYEFDLEKVVAR
jgi:hypothetical protein